MKCIRVLAVVILLGVVVLGIKDSVLASGSSSTGGVYFNGSMKKYNEIWRYVTDPSLPGPEVVFYMDSDSPNLLLGTWNCMSGYDGPLYDQFRWSYNTVAYFGSPRVFCVVTWGVGSAGDFSGTLYWD